MVSNLGNFSIRDSDQIYITASGLPYENQTPQDVIIIDLEGNHLEGPHQASSEKRVHLAIYHARADVKAVVHTHSLYATAWSFLQKPLNLDSEELHLYIGSHIETATFGATGTEELAQHTARALGNRQAVLMAKHGPVSVGSSLEEAFNRHLIVERIAHMSWLLKQSSEL